MSNILIVTKWYPNNDNLVHGIFVKEFIKAKKLYNDVMVLYSELTTKKTAKFPYQVHDNIEDGIRTIRFIYKRYPLKLHRIINLIGWLHCIIILNRDKFKPDIIHFHEYDASIPVFIFAKTKHIPLVVTEHFTGFVKNILSIPQRILAKVVFRNSTMILPVSQYLKKHLLAYAPKQRFEVVNNVVDTSLFAPKPCIIKNKNEKKQIITVARLCQNKGFFYLIEALNDLRKTRTDFILNIVGDGELREELEDLVIKLNLSEYVKFHGMLQKQVVADYISKCDFFVLPSLFETFGVVLIEAMACGKPVVATNIGGPDEIVSAQTGILVESANSQALRDGIDYMLDNYFRYSPDDITNYVNNHFSFKAIGLKLDQIYKDIIKKNGKKAN